MQRLKHAWRRRPIIVTGFILAVVFTGLFAFRSVAFMIYWSNPDHQYLDIQGWMTPRYVAQSWRLPPRVMRKALGTENMPGRRQSLTDIAAAQGVTLDELVDRITKAATSFRDSQ